VLQKSYYGKVKMIYIDPPYNTGNDSFVYPDNYSETLDEYQRRTGEKNEAGFLNKQNLWKKNSKESGQYHSAWLSMMYPRLYLARNLLRDDGVIFISIDDNEAANLKLLCDEVFGFENFVAQIIWRKKSSPDARSTIGSVHDYLLCYVRDGFNPKNAVGKMALSEKRLASFSNPDNDPRGAWASVDMTGMTARMQLRRTYNSPSPLISLTTENGRIAINVAQGSITLNITAADTTMLTGSGVYDLELVNSTVVNRILEGSYSVCAEVTK
jgi:adenine-specific DNA-methyltransferase